jgi:hypothetical protein
MVKRELGTIPYEQMKLTSDNIEVVSGRMIIQNVNWFPDERVERYTRAGLVEIVNRIYDLGHACYTSFQDDDYRALNLVSLNTPWIVTIESRKKYRLYSGFIYWGDKLIKEDFIFTFDEDSNIIFEGQEENFENITVLPADWREVKYDYYRGGNAFAVSEIVRNELGVPEYEVMDENEDNDIGEKIEIHAIHVPNLRDTIPGRIFVPSHTYDADGDNATDGREYSRIALEAENFMSWRMTYDQFRVEIIDKKQPFGYIIKEREIMDSKDNYRAITTFTNDTFDYSLKRRLTHTDDDMSFLFCDAERILQDFLYIFGKATKLNYCEDCDGYKYMPIGEFRTPEKVIDSFDEQYKYDDLEEDELDDVDDDDCVNDIDDDFEDEDEEDEEN